MIISPWAYRKHNLWVSENRSVWNLPLARVMGKATRRSFTCDVERERTEIGEPMAWPVERDLKNLKLLRLTNRHFWKERILKRGWWRVLE